MSEQLEQIVDLIRAEDRSRVIGFAISTAEAMNLIEQYAKAQAGGAVIEALNEAHERTMAILSPPPQAPTRPEADAILALVETPSPLAQSSQPADSDRTGGGG